MLKTITASYGIAGGDGRKQVKARILVAEDEEFVKICFDTGISEGVCGSGTLLGFVPCAVTRYYWKVQTWDERGEETVSETAWFETGLGEGGFEGIPVMPDMEPEFLPVMEKEFYLEKGVEKGRLYLCGLGVFEAYLNGKRIGNEVLTPYLTSYHSYLQYLTFDVGSMLKAGRNVIEVYLGDGWYKGMYGFRQNEHYREGKNFELLAQLNMEVGEGEIVKIVTDLSWFSRRSNVLESDIYNGETLDDAFGEDRRYGVKKGSLDVNLVKARLSLPVLVKERIRPVSVMNTPKGETVIDMGQNMTGWLAFCSRLNKGDEIVLEHGEVLQDGCFYHDNYRTAKSVFRYISDGMEKMVRPRFTFFGFRYVRVTSKQPVDLEDWLGEVVYSDLEETGRITTGNQLLNRLITNIMWSQKGNFLDVPTDCPQRDERLGWTGDAQIFSGTACMNMECYAFFRKYLHDLKLEQMKAEGMVPQLVPNVDRSRKTSAAWGDAAVIIPWTMYRIYGDASILQEQYESMESWIEYIDRENEREGSDSHLWQNGFHYGDWLALDGGYYHMPVGGTEVYFISSAYFYYSVWIMAQVSAVLGLDENRKRYSVKADKIRKAIRREYFSQGGRMCMDTQTGYIVSLVFGLYEDEKQKKMLEKGLLLRLRKDSYLLTTGFVGTPFLLPVLSRAGRTDLAYRILLNTECPGWLYPVTMGATTMWERWDSIKPDGHMSDNGMNSLNHYANGSVMEWMYEWMAGIRQKEGSVGFRKVYLCPGVHPSIGHLDAVMHTANGTYRIYWEIMQGGVLKVACEIPSGAEAEVQLPFAEEGRHVRYRNRDGEEIYSDEITYLCTSGKWEWEYVMDKRYVPYYSIDDSVKELVKNSRIREYLYQKLPMLGKIDGAEIQNMTLHEMARLPFFLGIGTQHGITPQVLEEAEEFVGRIPRNGSGF